VHALTERAARRRLAGIDAPTHLFQDYVSSLRRGGLTLHFV
jgi:hypothetical protein